MALCAPSLKCQIFLLTTMSINATQTHSASHRQKAVCNPEICLKKYIYIHIVGKLLLELYLV